MQQPQDKFSMFRNRLEKINRHRGRQARRLQISCYRLYDHDMPEFPFIIERYNDHLHVSEYRRRHGMTAEEHESWLASCRVVMAEVLDIDQDDIHFKSRYRKPGRQGQYRRAGTRKKELIVEESGLRFIVNLTDYLDTGLFLDHRDTRRMVKELASGKEVLNLFCYTGSFSVYAMAGGAAGVLSVDLSRTYLDWAERNMELNFPGMAHARFEQRDVLQYLGQLPSSRFGLVILDPPTFSNSKRMESFLDIQKDHAKLVNDILRVMTPGGILLFSTNYTRFTLEREKLEASDIRDITRQTIPFDFEKLHRPCYLIIK